MLHVCAIRLFGLGLATAVATLLLVPIGTFHIWSVMQVRAAASTWSIVVPAPAGSAWGGQALRDVLAAVRAAPHVLRAEFTDVPGGPVGPGRRDPVLVDVRVDPEAVQSDRPAVRAAITTAIKAISQGADVLDHSDRLERLETAQRQGEPILLGAALGIGLLVALAAADATLAAVTSGQSQLRLLRRLGATRWQLRTLILVNVALPLCVAAVGGAGVAGALLGLAGIAPWPGTGAQVLRDALGALRSEPMAVWSLASLAGACPALVFLIAALAAALAVPPIRPRS